MTTVVFFGGLAAVAIVTRKLVKRRIETVDDYYDHEYKPPIIGDYGISW